MAGEGTTWLRRVYSATTDDELEEGYDGWARDYDQDLLAMGYRLPTIVAGFVGRHVAAGEGSVLDAGCGTGLIGETLSLLGYGPIAGLDFSQGMLDAAGRKNVYASLHRMKLGEHLDFPDGHFAAVTAVGVLTLGHARPDSFDELIRITRPGGHMVFSIRVDVEPKTGFLARQDDLEAEDKWARRDATEPFQSMPDGEPEVMHRVFAYRVA